MESDHNDFGTHQSFLHSSPYILQVQKKPAKSAAAPPRFEIKKWNAVAMWSWDICADTVCAKWISDVQTDFVYFFDVVGGPCKAKLIFFLN
jgi:hypothetical protein